MNLDVIVNLITQPKFYTLGQGWRINGTRHIILGTPPITKFTMKYDEEKTQFRANQSKHGNPSRHNDQLGVVKEIPIGACSGIGFYAGGGKDLWRRAGSALVCYCSYIVDCNC
ncbi:hypothetical protein AVEN_151239-1 [Araneus ventricosus]|uniref:Uncharacterized protein n=1 Tax=Araneus ventricosus TaxID=182803 RepID=A0A4Y2MFT7_ARAVE|nr:hypothetical protein AVEN_151239-1 [Araneus ventricosus]